MKIKVFYSSEVYDMDSLTSLETLLTNVFKSCVDSMRGWRLYVPIHIVIQSFESPYEIELQFLNILAKAFRNALKLNNYYSISQIDVLTFVAKKGRVTYEFDVKPCKISCVEDLDLDVYEYRIYDFEICKVKVCPIETTRKIATKSSP